MEIKIAGKYRLLQTIGQGGFGDVYKAEETKTGKIRAIKLERRVSGEMIFFESRVLKYLQDVVGLPKLHDFGFEGDFNFMVMDYCGYSISSLHELCGGKFSLKVLVSDQTACLLGLQLLNTLETVHNKHILHRDIKPENFLFDPTLGRFFLIDFGLSKRYMDRHGKHIPREENKHFRGTLRYCSLNVHLGVESTRRDDLESFMYVLIYLIKGHLPWQSIKVAVCDPGRNAEQDRSHQKDEDDRQSD